MEIATVGGAATAPTVGKIFGLIVPAAAIATKIITAVRAVSTFIMENLLFTDVKIVLPRYRRILV
jgi:hypothetical protein